VETTLTNQTRLFDLEREIHQLFIEFSFPDVVAEKLLEKYSNQNIPIQNLRLLCTFFMRCGFWGPMLEFLIPMIRKGHPIPWAHLTDCIHLSSDKDDKLNAALFDGAKEFNQLEELARSIFLDQNFPTLRELREKSAQEIRQRFDKKKRELMAKAQILQSQDLNEAENLVMRELIMMAENDSEIIELKKRRRELQHSRLLKQTKNAHRLPLEIYERRTNEEDEIIAVIDENLHQILAEQFAHLPNSSLSPSLAYDFAIMHFFWGHFPSAYTFVRLAPPSANSKWLAAEILLRQRKFLDLLSLLTHYEIQFSNEPESLTAIIYLRAQSYWGLGQKAQALSLMEELVHVQPQYKNAASILTKWRLEVE
jgi:hypothetical protein